MTLHIPVPVNIVVKCCRGRTNPKRKKPVLVSAAERRRATDLRSRAAFGTPGKRRLWRRRRTATTADIQQQATAADGATERKNRKLMKEVVSTGRPKDVVIRMSNRIRRILRKNRRMSSPTGINLIKAAGLRLRLGAAAGRQQQHSSCCRCNDAPQTAV
jgi:hypothetical protein